MGKAKQLLEARRRSGVHAQGVASRGKLADRRFQRRGIDEAVGLSYSTWPHLERQLRFSGWQPGKAAFDSLRSAVFRNFVLDLPTPGLSHASLATSLFCESRNKLTSFRCNCTHGLRIVLER